MPIVFTEPGGEAIGFIHHQPHPLTQQQRDAGHEVPAEAVVPPTVGDGEVARPYWRNNTVVWEVVTRHPGNIASG